MNAVRRLGCFFSILGLSLICRAALTGEQPQLSPFTAEYSLSRSDFTFAKVEIALTIDRRGVYRYSADTTPIGLTAVLHRDQISEISNGVITDEGVVPQNYHYRHRNSDSPRSVDIKFDWPAMRVTNSLDGTSWSMKIQPGTQDKFSQQLSLMHSVAAGNRTVEFPVADGGRAKDYSFSFQVEEVVDVEAGSFQSLKMARSKNRRASQASLWLAPKLNYLPVIVEKKERDGLYLMKLKRFAWTEPSTPDQ